MSSEPLTHRQNVRVIRKKVEVDAGLHERVRPIQRHLAPLGHGAQEIDNGAHIAAILGNWIVPLKCRAEHAHRVELKMRLPTTSEGIPAHVGRFRFPIRWVLVQPLVNPGKAHELQ